MFRATCTNWSKLTHNPVETTNPQFTELLKFTELEKVMFRFEFKMDSQPHNTQLDSHEQSKQMH